jgi:hypothetical protein
MEQLFYIQIGSKRLTTFERGALPYSHKYVGFSNKEADELGFTKVAQPTKMFATSNNCWYGFHTIEEAKKTINDWAETLQHDDRFEGKIKERVIAYCLNLQNKITI